MPWSHMVEVQVSTGIWRNSGTTANVFIVLEGELGTSRPYHLKHHSCIPFARGSIISFVISIPANIGTIETVRIWHDNSGTSPSWFLNHIKVSDLSTRIERKFVCFSWLAVDKGDGQIDRTLRFTSADDRRIDFPRMFRIELLKKSVIYIYGFLSSQDHQGIDLPARNVHLAVWHYC